MDGAQEKGDEQEADNESDGGNTDDTLWFQKDDVVEPDLEVFSSGSTTDRIKLMANEIMRLAVMLGKDLPTDQAEEEERQPWKKLSKMDRLRLLGEAEDSDEELIVMEAEADEDDDSPAALRQRHARKTMASEVLDSTAFVKRLSFGLERTNGLVGPQDVDRVEREFLDDGVRSSIEKAFIRSAKPAAADERLLEMLGHDTESRICEEYLRLIKYFSYKRAIMERRQQKEATSTRFSFQIGRKSDEQVVPPDDPRTPMAGSGADRRSVDEFERQQSSRTSAGDPAAGSDVMSNGAFAVEGVGASQKGSGPRGSTLGGQTSSRNSTVSKPRERASYLGKGLGKLLRGKKQRNSAEAPEDSAALPTAPLSPRGSVAVANPVVAAGRQRRSSPRSSKTRTTPSSTKARNRESAGKLPALPSKQVS